MTQPVDERPDTEADEPTPAGQTGNALPSWSSSDTLQHELGKAPALPPGEGFGDYELLGEIARGGMGVVYRAWQRSLQRTVALKMILQGQLASEPAVQRFQQEARAAAGLDHPHIVPIYEVGQHDGRHYFTMALVDGPNLSAAVRRGGLLAVDAAAALMVGVTEAVAYAHGRGIIHRDLKPDNVLVDSHGRPRVTDFGLAKSFIADSGLTASGEVLGTPSYMAPEQAMGQTQLIGPPADIYALGGILYFLLTGKPPFTGSSAVEVLYRAVHEPPVSPRKLNPAVPPELEAVCLKCLEKDPARRYGTAAEVAAALRPWAGADLATPSRPLSAVAAPAPETPSPGGAGGDSQTAVVGGWSRRRLLAAALAVVAAGLLVVGGYLAFRPGNRPAEGAGDGDQALRPGNKPAEGGAGRRAKQPLLPVISHHDFGLKVEMLGAVQGKDGELTLTEGQTLAFRIVTARDAYVGVWSLDADGIRQIFPNKFESNHLVKAGEPRLVPGPALPDEYVLKVASSGPIERVWVVASTKPWKMPEAEKEGPFAVFRGPKVAREILLVPVAKGLAAEELLNYRVTPLPGRGK